ncbi:MAG: DUF4998 domain-containing protein [Bacteroidota bacterium]
MTTCTNVKLSICLSFFFIILATATSCKKAGDTSAPAEVTNIKIYNGTSDVKLTWNDPSDGDFQKVRITCKEPCESKTVEIPKGVQSAEFKYLVSGTEYSFLIKTADSHDNQSAGITTTGIPDYRNGWVGNYHFTNYNHLFILSECKSKKAETDDTIEYNGSVAKFETDKVKIIYLPGYIEPDLQYETFPMIYAVYGLIYPNVGTPGIFSYPGMPGRYEFTGSFTGGDSIRFSFSHATHMGDESYRIFGKKIN